MKNVIKHFQDRKFEWAQSAPLVAKNSTTVPFCISGGVPYEAAIAGDNVMTGNFASMQNCIRTAKLEGIGSTGRHHICFNMLGHFMLGTAGSFNTKIQMIETAYSFLLSFGLNEKEIAATADPNDCESQKIWNGLGVKLFVSDHKRVQEARAKRSGYQTEILYKIGKGDDINAYRELWNNVIYQFATPVFTEPMSLVCADSGASWDRIISAKESVTSNYDNSLWKPYFATLGLDSKKPTLCRVIEFVKAVAFLGSETDFYPSNKGAGYEFRKIARRMFVLCEEQYLDWYYLLHKSSLYFHLDTRYQVLIDEIEKFKKALIKGYAACMKNKEPYSSELADLMYDSHGFPKELFTELKQKGGISWIEKLKQ